MLYLFSPRATSLINSSASASAPSQAPTSPPPPPAAAAAGECDVLARLKAASDDCDADDDTDRRQFVLNAQRFLASSSLSLTSCHRNMTVIRGQDTVALMFSS